MYIMCISIFKWQLNNCYGTRPRSRALAKANIRPSAASFPLDPAVKQPLMQLPAVEARAWGRVLWQTIGNNFGIGRGNSDNCSERFADVGKQIAIVYCA